MRSMAEALLTPTREAGAVRADLTVADLMAVTNAAALASANPSDAVRMMYVPRRSGAPVGL
jgi:hypothetical protein